jgi:hypothetical protein
MTRRRYIEIGSGVLLLGVLVWGITKGLERLVAPPAASTNSSPAAGAAPPAVAHITATLFYATADGQALAPVHREVPLAEGVVRQGREILAMQLEGAPPPYLSAIPAGTMLRAFYVTERGDAFVDLSSDVSTKHWGGSFTELLTVYAIVNAVTANLPTVQRVQILIDGKEAETLAGHVDLRRPLIRDVTLVREPET